MKRLVEVLSTSPRGRGTKVASGVLNVAYTKTPGQQKFRKGKKIMLTIMYNFGFTIK
jgi:hypothetical protein